MIADEGDVPAIGREPGIVAGSRSRKANLHSRAVVQIVEPKASVGVEEQVGRVGRPQVAGHVVALAMIAVPFGAAVTQERSHLFRAHHHVNFAGRGIHIHQLAAVEIAQVLAVRRPVELRWRLGNQRTMCKDCLHCELTILCPRRTRMRSQRQCSENGKQKSSGSRQ